MLSADNWARLEELLARVIERSRDEQDDYLRQLCGKDEALHEEAASLLAAHRAAGPFLEEMDVARAAALISPEANLEPGASVGPYRIVRRLGQGGMGVVYVAEDVRLDRRVALKFLPPEQAVDEEARRHFQQEARAAAALDHPNIGVIHEIAQSVDGTPFIAMAFYEGQTLSELISAESIPVRDAVNIARQVAGGLQAAHRQGILHRDIKPSNILLIRPEDPSADGATAKIVDFGIARFQGSDSTFRHEVRGTISYMSPEQTRGDAIDQRTDVWSLGVVLYEMLTGERPFRGESDRTLIHAIRFDDPPPVERLRPEAPPALRRIVDRCLEKDAALRYPNCAVLVDDLNAVLEKGSARARGRRLAPVIVSVTAILAFIGTLFGVLFAGETDDLVLPARLVILPFDNLSTDPAEAYLADGLTAELISSLSNVEGLRVVGGGSPSRFAEGGYGAAEMARLVGATAVLQGSVRKEGDRLGIIVHLLNAQTEEHLWTENIDASMTEVLSLPREIARSVARSLDVHLPSEEWRRVRHRPQSVQAYEHYMRGRYYLDKFDEASVILARDHFQQALDVDPAYAEAWAGLADTYKIFDYHGILMPREASRRARAAAERALQLDPDLAGAHVALATVLADYFHDWESALLHFRRALELDPGYAVGRQLYAELLRDLGRFDEALSEIRTAQDLDPLSPFFQMIEGIIYHFARQYEEALLTYERLLGDYPDYRMAHFYAGIASADSGLYQRALDDMEAFDPVRSLADGLGIRALVLAMMGRQAEARVLVRELESLSQHRAVSPFHFALIHIALHENEKALDFLEKTLEERHWFVRLFRVLPALDPIRAEPRFQALLAQVGMPEP